MDSYVQLYIESGLESEDPRAIFAIMLLALARLLPIIIHSPFLGARLLPHPVKMALAISLFAIFLPSILVNMQGPISFNTTLLFLMLKEMFIGFGLGVIISVPFIVVQNVGMLIDNQRGGASLMVNDPTIQNQSSPIGTMFNMVLIYLFFVIDGPFYFFNAIVISYEIMPIDQFIGPHFFNKDTAFWKLQFDLLNKVMLLTTQLVAPALVTILMTDMFLGIANRLAPQVQITFLGMPLKSLLALMIVALGWKLYNAEVIKQVFIWISLFRDSIGSFL